jgi:uncharacterized protein YndB with AHSA1/START domain
MADILHRFTIEAPAARVHELVANPAGIQGWWTGHAVAGQGGVGGKLSMFFGGSDPAAVMEVTEHTPGQITWHVVDGPTDWLDTDITFTFRPTDGGGTTLLFSHTGWREAGEFMANCTSEWASYLIGLKAGLEGGSFTPFPIGQVSRWG